MLRKVNKNHRFSIKSKEKTYNFAQIQRKISILALK